MKLTKKQIKALKTLLNYCSDDECEDFDGSDDHIWASIRVVYAKVYGKKDLKELEESFESHEECL